MKRSEVRALYFVSSLHLAHQEFGITADSQILNSVGGGVIQRGDQAVVFRDVIGDAPDVFADFVDCLAVGTMNHHGVRGGAGISAGGAVDVGGVNGWRGGRGGGGGFRIGKESCGARRLGFRRRGHSAPEKPQGGHHSDDGPKRRGRD